ncbi:P-loop containing nucleoside triphosphate hydrolase protein [Gorgonomyces haynaldii]|nr:P-loop containing nucleoside triphosphate hydrolase protein [Gorgonomyces haynaldii]
MLFDEPGEGLTQVVLFDKTKYVDLLSCLSIHGLASFREGQEQVIMNILQGKSTMAVLPTGHGKSLLYQLPTFIFSLVDPDCYTLVISPTISLMNDQMRCLPPHLGGLMITGDDISALEHVKQRKCKVLFVSPEKLMNKHFLELLQSPDMPSITLGCVDEVHCMSEWSHNFRSAYLHLPQIFEQLQITNILCLTGTATKTIADYCTRVFKIEHLITSKIMRSNLYPHIIPTEADQRDAVLVELLKSEFRKKSVIIYVSFQHQADQLAQHLRLRSLNAESYHAGKPSKQRLFLQQEFTIGRIDVLVCTVAFGLGVNKSNVDTVIHYTMPKSLENYVQEIGRAGRDGRICECFCFLVKDDYILQRSLCFQDSITNSQLQMLLDRLLKTGEEICFISANDCEQQLDIKPSMVESVLSYLELAFDHLKKQKSTTIDRSHGWCHYMLHIKG